MIGFFEPQIFIVFIVETFILVPAVSAGLVPALGLTLESLSE